MNENAVLGLHDNQYRGVNGEQFPASSLFIAPLKNEAGELACMVDKFIEQLLNNPGQLSLFVMIIYIIADKVIYPFYKLMSKQSDNQRQIVQAASEDSQRNDNTVTSLIQLLSSNLTLLSETQTALKDNAIRQTGILEEIKTTTHSTNKTVGGIPLTLEQRFNLLERRHERTQKMLLWMMTKMQLPLREIKSEKDVTNEPKNP